MFLLEFTYAVMVHQIALLSAAILLIPEWGQLIRNIADEQLMRTRITAHFLFERSDESDFLSIAGGAGLYMNFQLCHIVQKTLSPNATRSRWN